MKIKTNLVSGALFVILGILLLLLMPGQIVVSDTTPFLESARVGPTSAVIMMLTGGMILLFKSIVLKKEHIVTVYFSDQKHALFIIAAIILFAGMIYFTGYIIAAVVLTAALYRFYRIDKPILLFIALATAILVYLLFTNVFSVSLPGIGGV